jgi:hypothetical protein
MKTRLAALGTTSGLVLALLLAVAPSAHAAWGTQHTFHGAKVQLCKMTTAGGSTRVRVRVDNRGGEHTHHGSVGRTRNGEYHSVQVRAAAGRVSSVKAITYRLGDDLDWGGGEGEGINFGDSTRIGRIPAC